MNFNYFKFFHIPRSKNAQADSLSQLTTSEYDELEKIFVEHLESLSIDAEEEIHQAQVGHEPSWIDPINEFLLSRTLPTDPIEACRMKKLVAQYVIINDQLYRRSISLPLLKYLRPSEADYALREVHEGICGNHLGGRLLSYKILRQGYYWLTMQKDAADLVRKCDQCQKFADIQRLPSSHLTAISAP